MDTFKSDIDANCLSNDDDILPTGFAISKFAFDSEKILIIKNKNETEEIVDKDGDLDVKRKKRFAF